MYWKGETFVLQILSLLYLWHVMAYAALAGPTICSHRSYDNVITHAIIMYIYTVMTNKTGPIGPYKLFF